MKYPYINYDLIQPKKSMAGRTHKDDRTQSMYRCYIQQRNQALFRDEGWDMVFDEWKEMWDEHFEQRGKKKTQYSMLRLDTDKPWSKENSKVMRREEQLAESNARKSVYEFNTPLGTFYSLKEAAKAHGVSPTKLQRIRKKNPAEYYYTKDLNK